jgi:hypothetical protein
MGFITWIKSPSSSLSSSSFIIRHYLVYHGIMVLSTSNSTSAQFDSNQKKNSASSRYLIVSTFFVHYHRHLVHKWGGSVYTLPPPSPYSTFRLPYSAAFSEREFRRLGLSTPPQWSRLKIIPRMERFIPLSYFRFVVSKKKFCVCVTFCSQTNLPLARFFAECLIFEISTIVTPFLSFSFSFSFLMLLCWS